jgi:dTDP-4-amino-4,6-dideoxygalactose transaminase
MCSIPVFAAPFAGWTPIFSDVNVVDGNFDAADLERTLAETENVGAIVPVHMFGKMDDVDHLQNVCKKAGVDLIEDVALSLGSHRGTRPAGLFGRLSTLSFVRKTLPIEMGGAVLTDEPELADRARAFVAGLPPEGPGRREEVSAAMKAFHALTAYVAVGGWKRLDLLRPFQEEFRRLLLASTGPSDWAESVVLEELAKVDDRVQARRVRAEVYETVLNHPALLAMDRSGSNLFAYPVRLLGRSAEEFLAFAESRGHSFRRIAYPDISPLFGSTRRFPNAEILEKETIGLPVDDGLPVSHFWEYAEDFRAQVEAFVRAEAREFDWRGKLEQRMG